MKKLLAFLLVCVCLLPLPTVAEEAPYATMSDLEIAWRMDRDVKRPKNLCGVWCEGSREHMVIGIQNTDEGEAIKQEILSQIADDSSVTFVYQTYTLAHLQRISHEIRDQYNYPGVVIGWSIHQMDNRVVVRIEQAVKDDEETQAIAARMTEAYGDAIEIIYCTYSDAVLDVSPAGPDGDHVVNVADSATPPYLLWAVAILLPVGLVACLLVVKSRRKAMARLTTGQGVTLTRREVEELVIASVITPPAALENRVLSEIEK